MMNKQTEIKEQQKINSELKAQLLELDRVLEEKKIEREKMKRSLDFYKKEFIKVQDTIEKLSKSKKEGIATIKAIPAYALGRRNVKQLYSRKYKQKNAANKIKKYKLYLYNLGFTDKALSDLQSMFLDTKDLYVKRAIAWELGLWYANKLTKDAARMALVYMDISIYKEKEPVALRKAAILKAEAYELLNEPVKGMEVITDVMENQTHADLYLAAANLEATVEGRVKWINKALRLYDLQEIMLASSENVDAYYNLKCKPVKKQITNGPKVSVIIPAYNSELGIRVAIDSILSQTWNNLEVLVVDDCSTDDTAQIIAQYTYNDTRVRLLKTPVNSGPYIARNIALKEATGEFVTINDADDWSHPEKIEKQVNNLIEQQDIIANTSEHARLTEALKLYRRGMPGEYIFSNMSSIMFRREQVLEKIGYWDSIRFAADSEFKRRIEAVFGKDKITDLKTGPLSFPMQSSGSLTGNAVFGYSGFLMGIRKEYAETYRRYHQKAKSLYVPFPQNKRPFPVPEPMWPKREEKKSGKRQFDIVLISDFRKKADDHLLKQISTFKKMGMRTGLIQMGQYDFRIKKEINPTIRQVINGESVQMLVYGESITCDVLIINNPGIFQERQKYVPTVSPRVVRVIINQLPKSDIKKAYNLRQCSRRIEEYVNQKAKWYPINQQIRDDLMENHRQELKSIPLSTQNWVGAEQWNEASFVSFIENWLVDDNPLKLK
ncbi:glycosyltransferase family 2 protein [Oceanobacillus longus]|uniref:Glycosyltransferase family 2 protein n=1 Tax=Oceanobacillus longus TaxID=930120 RepID=A0ABV8H264_9BACI